MGGFSWRDLMMDSDSSKSSGPSLLLKLPPELLAYILSFLSGKDIANAAKVCKAFNEAIQVENAWKRRCLREYNADLPEYPLSITYKNLYTKILHKYGQLRGLWQTDINCYGGLVQVKYENGKLLGIEWHPPSDPKLHDPLRRKDLFSIEISPSGQTEILCLKGHREPHKCQIIIKNKTNFFSKCCSKANHKRSCGKEQEFLEWVKEETSLFPNFDSHVKGLYVMKFLIVKGYENSFEHRRINLPQKRPNAIIQPGIFKGTYSAHGLELVMLSYEVEGSKVKITKLTGDPNVPAGKITLEADLRYPVVLSETQQLDMQELQRQEAVASPIPLDRLKPMPFRIPHICQSRDQEVPNMCKARFYAFGQVAGHGFTNPSFTGGHWIIFNEDLFGFLWFELLTLSLFHRVQEKLY